MVRRLVMVALAGFSVAAAAPQSGGRDLREWMQRVATRVEQYYARAQSIICEETVRLEPLGSDLLPNGEHIRELVYELRVAWDGASDEDRARGTVPEATVQRQLLRVDGRPPRAKDEPGCFDPKAISPEPLGMLLVDRQRDFVFSWKGQGKESGRESVTLEYKPAVRKPPPVDVVMKRR